LRYSFQHTSSDIFFDSSFSHLKKLADQRSTVLITDQNVYDAHAIKFKGWNSIVLKAGEEFKVQATIDAIINELIRLEADRSFTIVGVGGGVITDISGYVASIYMRGLRFGFVPTSLLGMIDASIGGKNGIDVGAYKNLAGTTRQPSFILYDTSFLKTLPLAEWENGFAEVVKHAAIKNAALFRLLEKSELKDFQGDKSLLKSLIRTNAMIKLAIVKKDEFEKGERRLLNFGHTLGHALENQYELSHGQAVSLGMSFAATISEKLTGFRQAEKLKDLLSRYGLPVAASFNKNKVWDVLKMDKKRQRKELHFVLLRQIGQAVIEPISLTRLEKLFNAF
jgi:3-dehydroquinate synthase